MGGDNYNELILEAIDQLRKRKARPDLERICHMLERRHGLKSTEVNEQLLKMVNEGIVIKVDYKGNTSYRNAAKWVRTKSLFKPEFTSSDMSIAVQEAVDAISQSDESGNNTIRCASLHDIEKYLLKRDAVCNMNIATLRSTLEREVANGNIRQVRIGEYVSVKNNSFSPSKTDSDKKPDEEDTNKLHSGQKKLKVGFIIKDEELCCDYCLLTATANHKGGPEGLLICSECNMKAHPICVDYSEEAAKKVLLCPWQCPDCKMCNTCKEYSGEDPIVICKMCDRGFHMKCHIPPVFDKPASGKWMCGDCIIESCFNLEKAMEDAENSDAVLQSLSKEETDTLLFQKCLEGYPEVVPVVDSWAIDQVEVFFKYIGFQKEAVAFREQEIDGPSLLMLKRNDVLTGLPFKLGPALKIYSHIQRLQNLKTDSLEIYSPD